MNTEYHKEALRVLYNLCREMNTWENNTKRRWEEYSVIAENDYGCDPNGIIDDENWNLWMQEYMDIYNKYCSPKACVRERSISTPRSYDPGRMQVDSIEESPSGDLIFRTSYRDYPLMDLAYQMTKENGEWKIRDRFYIAPDGSLLENEI